MLRHLQAPGLRTIVFGAALLYVVTMGIRQSFGLFISPVQQTTGLSIASVSLALAIGQFMWGAVQPLAGIAADRYGPRPVLVAGLVMLALGCLVTPFFGTTFGLAISLGVLAAGGSGIGSFSVLMGTVSQRIPVEARGAAAGIINAGGSLGQFIFAPIIQKLIQSIGWMGALASLAIVALSSLPLVGKVTGEARVEQVHASTGGLKQAVFAACRDRSYWLLHAGFFTCGFHVAFLVTHLPGEVEMCGLTPNVGSWALAIIGLANIFGSLFAGWCVSQYRSKMILAVMYGSRALLVVIYLWMPKTEWSYYLFAAGLGFTWLATVPPTAAIVGKLFGTRYLATLFGLTLLTHQIGGFLGAWLGGVTITAFGDFSWMWYADMALAAMAAVLNLPIREAPVVQAKAT